ncbi:MAG: hypothetical protein IJI23_04200 [Lachnospiraceae bacterium]|nr:hypothetical protein [Lachnospiraceae bacterium]
MAVVKMMIKKSDKPSKEQIQKMREAKNKPIVFDEDSPEMTETMLSGFARVYPKKEAVKM